MPSIITIENLQKKFGEVRAVDDISFSVEAGDLFAFLGLNGAGKSTTINILCSILKKDGGRVAVNGLDLESDSEKIKRDIGIVFQSTVLDERLTVLDNLTVRASFYGVYGGAWKSRLKELTDILGLDDILKRPFGKLSGGQKRRADIARGLINRPKILFLDEPTTGLDPSTRITVWNTVNNLRKDTGMTVFLTTHYMEEANKADRVVIMDAGKIVANDTPNNLKNRFSGDFVKLYMPKSQAVTGLLTQDKTDFSYVGESYLIKTAGRGEARKFLLRRPELCEDFEVIKGDMDDVFLTVTGKKLAGGNGN